MKDTLQSIILTLGVLERLQHSYMQSRFPGLDQVAHEDPTEYHRLYESFSDYDTVMRNIQVSIMALEDAKRTMERGNYV